MKTELVILEETNRPWFIGTRLSKRTKSGEVIYVGYSVENTEYNQYIGNKGTLNYFYIK